MLASKYLLTKRGTIEKVKDRGNIFQSRNFGVRVLAQENKDGPRFAFVVSTKISKLAVQRNRIKRALSEAVRLNVGKVPEGLDLVFLAKRSMANTSTDEIMREVEEFLRTSKFI